MNLDNLKNEVKKEEGYKLEVYIDTEGYPTGGYGHKIIDGEEIPTTKDICRAPAGALQISMW